MICIYILTVGTNGFCTLTAVEYLRSGFWLLFLYIIGIS